jgi:hypothetical protein
MKTNVLIGLALLVSVSAFAQEVDDMYFRSKDREKVNAASVSKAAQGDLYSSNYDTFKKKNFSDPTMLDEYYANPTDSYSARNVNPEFIARSNSTQAAEDEQNYFMEGYNNTFSSPAMVLSGNAMSMNNTWNNPMYSPGWFGPSWNNSFYSPYYGFNNPWGNSYWCGPGFNTGWSMNMSSFWGNGWNPGWSMGLGYSWGNPFMGNMWGPSWGMWNPWYYRPIVVVGEASRPNYGKRQTTSASGVNNISSRPVTARPSTPTVGTTTDPLGRQRAASADEYYVRPSRRTYSDTNTSNITGNPVNSGSRVAPSGTGTTGTRSYNSSPTRSFDSRSSSGYSSPTRNSSSGSFSSPSRSYSGSSSPSRSSGSMGSSGSSGSSGSRRGGN